MKTVLILVDEDGICKAMATDSEKPGLDKVVSKADFAMHHGAQSWSHLFTKMHDHLKLDTFASPGLPMGSGKTCRDALAVWLAVRCGTPQARGWDWGFMLPHAVETSEVPTETCCGFRTQEAAAKAAVAMRDHHLSGRTTGDLPGGVFEIFKLNDLHAFLDVDGEVHSTFPTYAEARGCAAKLEAAQMQTTNQAN